jgi:2,2-dialkylglycine decarboxylase (pyruvate)
MNNNKNKILLDEYRKYILPVLNFRDIVLQHGRGSYVWDINGTKILDLNSGQFCSIFGHSDEDLAHEIHSIALTLQDTDTSTLSESVLFAAKKLHDITPEMNSRSIFLSTGAEANECCLRYAKHLKEKSGVVAFDIGYHGLTHGTAAYSMSRTRIRPTIDYSYTTSAPKSFSDDSLSNEEIDSYVQEFEYLISTNADKIAAAIFEPIISGGGLYFPPKYYFQKIRKICDAYNIFLIFDECQTGFGRTGTWFYYQQLGVIPDFVVSAKAMGLGYPVSCVIANGNKITNDKFAMMHYSSHQNEPFAGRIISYGINRIIGDSLLNSNIKNGVFLLNILKELAQKYELIVDPRGKGLMCGFNLHKPGITDFNAFGTAFCAHALQHKILLQHCNNGKTVRLLPNYIITQNDLEFFQTQITAAIKSFKY